MSIAQQNEINELKTRLAKLESLVGEFVNRKKPGPKPRNRKDQRSNDNKTGYKHG